MKTQKNLFAVLITLLLTSCVPTYYQVYKAAPSDKLVFMDDLITYEDDYCKVSYNLWDEGGDIGFQFFNKTDENIYLNLEESFFIRNGMSYNYYIDRVFTNSASVGATTFRGATATKSQIGVELMIASGFSVSYNETKIECIPSKTSKIISEYNINKSFFRDCDLVKYPRKNQIKSVTFSKEQSPFIFSNIIAYTIGKTDNLMRIENEFYVMEIANYPNSGMNVSVYEEECGKKSTSTKKYFRHYSADKFYIKYKEVYDSSEH